MLKTKVLFVDDNPDVLETLEIEFGDEYNLFVAKTGEEAIELKKKHNINIVVTDLKMPSMDGVELCKRIKEYDPLTVFIAMTGQSEFREFSLETGFDFCFIKPVNRNLLQDVIKEVEKRTSAWLKP